MKVKIIEEDHEKNLEEVLNYWLKTNEDKTIIDIKFSTMKLSDYYGYYAMIIYEGGD